MVWTLSGKIMTAKVYGKSVSQRTDMIMKILKPCGDQTRSDKELDAFLMNWKNAKITLDYNNKYKYNRIEEINMGNIRFILL